MRKAIMLSPVYNLNFNIFDPILKGLSKFISEVYELKSFWKQASIVEGKASFL